MGNSLKIAYQKSLLTGIKLKDKGPKVSELTPEFIREYAEQQKVLKIYYEKNPDKFKELN